jgi:hypothetical protein
MSEEMLKEKISTDIFDYQVLMYHLKDYKKPRDKVTRLINSKKIVRLRKGLYTWGDISHKRDCEKFILANLIYGPSVVSLESALAYYKVIEKDSDTITCITPLRGVLKETQFGDFSYEHMNASKYSIGNTIVELEYEKSFMMATLEKAVIDIVERQGDLFSKDQINEYIFEVIKMNIEMVKNLNLTKFYEIAKRYKSKKVDLLFKIFLEMR